VCACLPGWVYSWASAHSAGIGRGGGRLARVWAWGRGESFGLRPPRDRPQERAPHFRRRGRALASVSQREGLQPLSPLPLSLALRAWGGERLAHPEDESRKAGRKRWREAACVALFSAQQPALQPAPSPQALSLLPPRPLTTAPTTTTTPAPLSPPTAGGRHHPPAPGRQGRRRLLHRPGGKGRPGDPHPGHQRHGAQVAQDPAAAAPAPDPQRRVHQGRGWE